MADKGWHNHRKAYLTYGSKSFSCVYSSSFGGFPDICYCLTQIFLIIFDFLVEIFLRFANNSWMRDDDLKKMFCRISTLSVIDLSTWRVKSRKLNTQFRNFWFFTCFQANLNVFPISILAFSWTWTFFLFTQISRILKWTKLFFRYATVWSRSNTIYEKSYNRIWGQLDRPLN